MTIESFKALMPQFAGISATGDILLQGWLDIANLSVCCAKWGALCDLGRANFTAHYLSQDLEMLEQAETAPDTGGGTATSSDRIAQEKVGEVEIRFRALNNSGTVSTGNNDAVQEDFRSTMYGKRFLAFLRKTGNILTTTQAKYLC